jgi:hypothetical protein
MHAAGLPPVVKANGFTVVAHGAAIGADGALHYLSLLGRRASVPPTGTETPGAQGVLTFVFDHVDWAALAARLRA